MHDEGRSVVDVIRELTTYKSGVQVIAALKYGICPYLGHVFDNPSEENIELFIGLLNSYSKIRKLFEDELSEASQALLDASKKRQEEVNKGYVEENG